MILSSDPDIQVEIEDLPPGMVKGQMIPQYKVTLRHPLKLAKTFAINSNVEVAKQKALKRLNLLSDVGQYDFLERSECDRCGKPCEGKGKEKIHLLAKKKVYCSERCLEKDNPEVFNSEDMRDEKLWESAEQDRLKTEQELEKKYGRDWKNSPARWSNQL